MKIISWNCSQALRKKFPLLQKYNADIIVCQESEKLESDFFKGYHYQWTGKNIHKGIGVLTKKYPYSISKELNDNFIFYLPASFNDFNLMNVWTHTKADKFGPDANGNIIDALNFYKDWIASKNKAIIVGDFNNSLVFDEKYNWTAKFIDIKNYLYDLNFTSAYHSLFDEEFGNESKATLFHTKNLYKKFHIDYAFIRGFKIQNIEVGNYSDWIKYSDHVPLIIDIEDQE